MTRTARILSLVMVIALLAVGGTMPAFGAPATGRDRAALPAAAAVPASVRSWMSSKALPFVTQNSPDLRDATSTGTVRRVLQWSPALWAGHVTSTPVVATSTWVAPLRGSSGALGIVSAALQSDGTTIDGAFSSDPDLGAAIDRIRGAGDLVHDVTVSEWFLLDGSVISPLNAEAKRELSKPASLSDFASVVAARTSGSTGLDPAGAQGAAHRRGRGRHARDSRGGRDRAHRAASSSRHLARRRAAPGVARRRQATATTWTR